MSVCLRKLLSFRGLFGIRQIVSVVKKVVVCNYLRGVPRPHNSNTIGDRWQPLTFLIPSTIPYFGDEQLAMKLNLANKDKKKGYEYEFRNSKEVNVLMNDFALA